MIAGQWGQFSTNDFPQNSLSKRQKTVLSEQNLFFQLYIKHHIPYTPNNTVIALLPYSLCLLGGNHKNSTKIVVGTYAVAGYLALILPIWILGQLLNNHTHLLIHIIHNLKNRLNSNIINHPPFLANFCKYLFGHPMGLFPVGRSLADWVEEKTQEGFRRLGFWVSYCPWTVIIIS